MADPRRNAAIWFAEDGYDPDAKGVNGRRVAGASFLKGFAAHADVDEFVSLSQGRKGADAFAARMKALGVTRPVRGANFFNARKIAPLETVYFPAPNYAAELWRRQSLGASAYSICGITHTTATAAVMQGMVDLRAAPQQEWDAIVCTSRAVHASQVAQLDEIDSYFSERFGKVPARPQMPVIPLGLNVADHAHDATARARLRRRMGWKKDDIVFATLSRLTPYGKFDPLPLFIALENAQKRLPKPLKLHFVACGLYADGHSRKVFEESAAALMPSVSYTHLDGASATARSEALSGGDIFTFPIDNIQETFGLAPLEAMAAGLPVITADWDGMRDTVTGNVGITIPTRALPASRGQMDAWGYLSKRLSYAQYGNTNSALVEVDLAALTEAITALASDPAKRRAMGQAGLARVQAEYDWRVITPRYQDLWAELSAIRRTATRDEPPKHLHANPAAPAPQKLFASYPSEVLPRGIGRCAATQAEAELEEVYALRGYARMGAPFEKLKTLQAVLGAVEQSGTDGTRAEKVAEALRMNALTVDRCYIWLLKYGFLERVSS